MSGLGIGFLLRPMDWVAFGPPRANAAGETHNRATDLPYPTAFQGVVRTALLAASGDDLSDRSLAAQSARDALVGGPSSLLPGWQLRGPFFTEIATAAGGVIARPWLPAPRFLLGTRAKPLIAAPANTPPVDGGPAAVNDLSPDAEPILLARPSEGETDPIGGWLSPSGLRSALSGASALGPLRPRDHAPGWPSFVRRDRVTGLEINDVTGAAEDSMLYFADVLRFRYPSGIAGFLDAPLPPRIPRDALSRGDMATCGWRSRPAVLEALPRLDPDFEILLRGEHLPQSVAEDQGFFLVALTPLQCGKEEIAHGAIERDVTRLPSWPAGVRICVMASLTGPRRVIGGLEMASMRPRPNRSYWEAGSAWLFTLRGGGEGERGASARARALQALNDAHALGPREEASFGYGHTLVGVGPKIDEDSLSAAWSRKEGRP